MSDWRYLMDSDEARKNGSLLTALKKEVPDLKSETLDAGDYLIYRDTDEGPKNCLTIESKTPYDLIHSSRPEPGRVVGRLWRQVSRGQGLGEVAVLLRGVPTREDAFMYGIDMNVYVGILVSLARNRIPVVPTSASAWAVAATVSAMFKKHEKGPSQSRLSARPLPGVPWQVSVFAQLPNIGGRRAQMLMERVGTVAGLLEASEAVLKEVLGRAAGGKLYAVLREGVE